MNKKIIAILAVDDDFGIGKNNDIPWKSDLKNFKEITTKTQNTEKKNILIMGRKTWESIPEKFRPFKDRFNIVISNKNIDLQDKAYLFSEIEKSIEFSQKKDEIENIFIIGGASIYNQFFEKDLVDEIYLTKISGKFDCDAFVSIELNNFTLVSETDFNENENNFKLLKYKRCK